MVSHKEHRERTKRLLGDEYKWVHSWMDAPYAYLGRKHRVLRHDLITALALTIQTRDPKVLLAALKHLKDDKVI